MKEAAGRSPSPHQKKAKEVIEQELRKGERTSTELIERVKEVTGSKGTTVRGILKRLKAEGFVQVRVEGCRYYYRWRD